MGHTRKLQTNFSISNWSQNHSHGGSLRSRRSGRGQRPLTTKDPHHLVFKVHRRRLRTRSLRTYQNFQHISAIVNRYSRRFFVGIEQISIQGDHIHMLVRTSRRSHFHFFFRVVAGQIAQQFEDKGRLIPKLVTGTPARNKERGTGLWKFRPFTRVVRGYRDLLTVRNYIQLNEKEALGEIPYRKERLRGLLKSEREALWS